MVIKELRINLKQILSQKEDNDFEADWIISHVTGLPKSKWLLKNKVSDKIVNRCKNIANKRLKGEPLQYLISDWEFYGIPIKVGKGVLIPRPETETLVDFALSIIHDSPFKILDLCTGSGCIAAAIASKKHNVNITAIEVSDDAIKYAKKNLKPFKDKITLIKSNVLDYEFAQNFKNIDLIVCNPPYLSKHDMSNLQDELKYEPITALYGGKNGLDFFEKLPKIWKNSLKDGGWIAFEIGIKQKNSVNNFLKLNGYKNIKMINDLTGKCRVVAGQCS